MRVKCTYLAITMLFLVCRALSQECTQVQDEKTAIQFLTEHKSNSTAADPHCVDKAFTTLSLATRFKNKNYIEFLVQMLDFERWTPRDYVEAGEPKYPAINELHHLSSVGKNITPYLISGIKRKESDVLRTNAAEVLFYSVSGCEAIKLLTAEYERPGISSEERARLDAAAKYVKERNSTRPPCETSSSKP